MGNIDSDDINTAYFLGDKLDQPPPRVEDPSPGLRHLAAGFYFW